MESVKCAKSDYPFRPTSLDAMIQAGLLETGRVSSAFFRFCLSQLHMKSDSSNDWGSAAAYRGFWGETLGLPPATASKPGS